MDLYRRLVDGLEAIPGLTPVRDHRPRPVRRADADRGAAPRGDRAASGRRGPRRGGDRGLGRRLLRDRPDRAARPARSGRGRPDRTDPLQHRGRGRPARRRPRADRGGRPTGLGRRAADGSRVGALTDRPMARGAPAPDVAVIGGGILGTATAAFLAEAGLRVRLYERVRDRRRRVRTELGDRPAPVRPGPRGPLPAVARRVPGAGRSVDGSAFTFPVEPAGLLYVGHDGSLAREEAARWAARWPDARPEVDRGRPRCARSNRPSRPTWPPVAWRSATRSRPRPRRRPSPRSPPSAASRSSSARRSSR